MDIIYEMLCHDRIWLFHDMMQYDMIYDMQYEAGLYDHSTNDIQINMDSA